MKKEMKVIKCISNAKRHHTKKSIELVETRIKQLSNSNKRLQEEIEGKESKNAKLYKEYEKSNTIKSLYNETLNQIKTFNYRLEEKDNIIRDQDYIKQLHLKKSRGRKR
jgi:predicted RNase H-like nuclease (RuvC/YqgF family)